MITSKLITVQLILSENQHLLIKNKEVDVDFFGRIKISKRKPCPLIFVKF